MTREDLNKLIEKYSGDILLTPLMEELGSKINERDRLAPFTGPSFIISQAKREERMALEKDISILGRNLLKEISNTDRFKSESELSQFQINSAKRAEDIAIKNLELQERLIHLQKVLTYITLLTIIISGGATYYNFKQTLVSEREAIAAEKANEITQKALDMQCSPLNNAPTKQ